MANFEERIYALGTEALAEQERQVAELRGRGATLLAGGAVIASLLTKPVFGGDHPEGTAEIMAAGLGVIAAAALLICVVRLLLPRELGFSVNAARHTRHCGISRSCSSRWSISRLLRRSRNAARRTRGWCRNWCRFSARRSLPYPGDR